MRDEPLEAPQVERVRLDLDQVAGRTGDEDVRREHLAEVRDVRLEDVDRCLGRLLAPELVDQAIARDDLVRSGEEERKQRALPRAAQGERVPAVDCLERPEDPELHGRPEP